MKIKLVELRTWIRSLSRFFETLISSKRCE